MGVRKAKRGGLIVYWCGDIDIKFIYITLNLVRKYNKENEIEYIL